MQKPASVQDNARLRAELIMKVRCGLLTATQAARQLGISRKTYYKWEQRGLAALLNGLVDQSAGRPGQRIDSNQQGLETQLGKLRRENDLLTRKMALKDVLNDLNLQTGATRAKKK